MKTAAERVANIERARIANGWSHNELLRRARVDRLTWRAVRQAARVARSDTLDRLEHALLDVPAKRPPQIIRGFHRMVMLELCRRMGNISIDVVLATDFSVQRPSNKQWLRAARIKRMAIYITAVEFEVANADLGRAIGDSRQNVKQARDHVEDMRDKRTIDDVMTTVRRLAKGEAK